MTSTATQPAAVSDSWTKQLEQLKGRYKHVRPPILVALNVLLHDASVTLEDAKTRALMHGTRITAASVNAARTLMSRMDATPADAAPAARSPVTRATAATRAARRPRAATAPLDAEAMIRGMVGKLQADSNATTERLRDAVRKAIAMLQAAIG